MILHIYFARRFAMSFLFLTAIFCALVVLVDLIEQTRRFSEEGISFSKRLGLSFLNAPETINQILPIIVSLATVVMFIGLARTSELIVTRAAGRSAMRSLCSPIAVSLVVGGLAVAVLNPIVASTSKESATLTQNYRSGEVSVLSISSEGLWLRQGDANGQTVISAAQSNADASVLYDVTLVVYAPDAGPVRRIEAESASLGGGKWSLHDAKVWPLFSGVNPEANAKTHELLEIPSSLTLDNIRESLGKPSSVSIWELRNFIDQLEQAGFSARRHKVWFQIEMARPFFLMAMVLVAAAFTMRHTRSGGTGTAVLTAVLIGFGLFFIRSFAQILGENGQIPILLAAWAPPVAAIFLSLGFLLHAEDG